MTAGAKNKLPIPQSGKLTIDRNTQKAHLGLLGGLDVSEICSANGTVTQLVLKLFWLRDVGKNRLKVISPKGTVLQLWVTCVLYEKKQKWFQKSLSNFGPEM